MEQFKEAFPAGHFYSVLPDATELQRFAVSESVPLPEALTGISINREKQLQLLGELSALAPEFPYAKRGQPNARGLRYDLDNPMFSCGDALVLFCMLRRFGPRQVIEVGSGYSSAVMLDTNERFL